MHLIKSRSRIIAELRAWYLDLAPTPPPQAAGPPVRRRDWPHTEASTKSASIWSIMLQSARAAPQG